MSRAFRSLVAVFIALFVLQSAASVPEELDAQGFVELNSERDEVFNHVVQTLQEVTAQGQALERRLKATQDKLDETSEALAACLEEKAKQAPSKTSVSQEVYNDCVQKSQTARQIAEEAQSELKQLQTELKTVQKQAAKDVAACQKDVAGVDLNCPSELARLRQDYHKLQQEYTQTKASLSNMQRRLDNPDAFATACVTSPLAAAAAAAAASSSTHDVGVLAGSEAVNFWGGVGAMIALILLYMGLTNNKRRY